MEFVIGAVVVVALGYFVKRAVDRRRAVPPEDEWVLPPEGDAPTLEARPLKRAPWERVSSEPVLNRETLVKKQRDLDPSAWDDSPDSQSGTDVPPPGGRAD